MAHKHVANREAQWVALNTDPDWCEVDDEIIPFDISQDITEPGSRVGTRRQSDGICRGSPLEPAPGQGVHELQALTSWPKPNHPPMPQGKRLHRRTRWQGC